MRLVPGAFLLLLLPQLHPLLLLFPNNNNNGCNCGRRRRRNAPGSDEIGVRFFGLESILGGGGGSNCGCNCGGSNQGFTQWNGWSQGGSNQGWNQGGFTQSRCQCNYQLTFQDKYGRTHGACKQADTTGRAWCYTTGSGCSDAQQSTRFPNNPWSYLACTQP